jgi:phosphohistidine phosphatase SixA
MYRQSRRRFVLFALWIALVVPVQAAPATDEALWAGLASGDYVALLRHARAPGYSDPQNFTLDDCSTQRNLSAAGRAEARAIGDRFRAHGIETARVRSSQWCRCLDTARLLGLGAVMPTPALNSFFDARDREPQQTAAARRFLAKPTDKPRVFVTHQVNIRALSGVTAASGEIVVVAPDSGDPLRVVGRLAAPD